jgi:hypothetical protein
MEPILSKRGGGKPRPAGEPSVADFLDPSEFRIGPPVQPTIQKPERPVEVIPISNPVVADTPSLPNQGAAVASAAVAPDKSAGGVNLPNFVADGPARSRPPVIKPVAKDTSPSAGDLDVNFARNVKDYPKDVWAHLDYQLLQFLKDKPTPQLDVLAKLSADDRELISAVLDGLTNFRNAIRSDNNMLMSRKVRPLLDLADRVRAQADLVIPTMSLCTKVDGYGVYEPIEPARFAAMKAHPIIVYCEVENFASQLTEKKMWETKLSQEVVLYTETGLPVWKDKTQNIPDLARNRRHDFFVVKKTSFPNNITIGRYLLKVTIVDEQASRVAEATIPVQFVAQ